MAKDVVVVLNPFTYDASKHNGLDFKPKTNSPDDPCYSRTSQSAKQECDINFIVDNYVKNGITPECLNKRQAIYGDVSEVGTYHEALSLITRVNEAFATYDAKTRERFGNNPSIMLDFMANPANLDECVKLGLLPKEASEAAEGSASASGSPNAPETGSMAAPAASTGTGDTQTAS